MKTPLPTDIFKTGQVLNNTYEIAGVLGRGGTGEVYLARNQINERDCAIKALNAQFSDNAEYIDLMRREDQMRAIQHDAVVRYTEVSRSDAGHVFLVMDYIEGPSLSDVMEDRKLTPRELLIVAHRVLEGLVATHAHGIVHRDLSPDNIILRGGKPERSTIIDFGIAKDTAAGARTIVGNQFAGKYEYAAPEQLDGKATSQADLYALGATLLAAWRRDVPDLGTTPGEIMRRKAAALDTDGVPDPLRPLIEWLTQLRPEDRPKDAAEAVAWLDSQFRPDTGTQTEGPGGKARKRSRAPLVLGLVAFCAAAVGVAWFTGMLDDLFAPALQIASPYEMTATFDPDGEQSLIANAPDSETAAGLRNAYASAAGTLANPGEVTLAAGMPAPDWPDNAADLMTLASELENWTVTLSDLSANISGLAASRAARDAVHTRLTAYGTEEGLDVRTDLVAGPRVLPAAALEPYLTELASCGPLKQLDGTQSDYALFDTVTIIGDVAANTDVETIRAGIEPHLGDRDLRVETRTLNKDLCAIRAALPPLVADTVSIWLGKGETGEAALTGVFTTGENPVVDIQMPATLTGASLWVMVVDNTGKVFHVLPNINSTAHMIDDLGVIENGLRRVRILWPIAALAEDPTRLAIQVTEDDYGKSEVIAILSRTPLFDMRRPRDESVSSVAGALVETLKGREDEILGIASRIIDARP